MSHTSNIAEIADTLTTAEGIISARWLAEACEPLSPEEMRDGHTMTECLGKIIMQAILGLRTVEEHRHAVKLGATRAHIDDLGTACDLAAGSALEAYNEPGCIAAVAMVTRSRDGVYTRFPTHRRRVAMAIYDSLDGCHGDTLRGIAERMTGHSF